MITFIDQFNIKADMLMERLRSMSDGKTMVNLLNELNHTTLDAIAQVHYIIKSKLKHSLKMYY